jgi:rod shape-determining protein MreD
MRVIVIGSILLLTHVLQTTLFQGIRIGNVAPNFILMIVVAFSLLRGSKEGVKIGFGAGLIQDVAAGMIGPFIIIYTLIAYFTGRFNKNFYRENFILPFFCTILSSLFSNLFTIFLFLMRGRINVLYFIQKIVIPEMIYTLALSLIIYQLIYMVNERMEIKEKKTRSIFDKEG